MPSQWTHGRSRPGGTAAAGLTLLVLLCAGTRTGAQQLPTWKLDPTPLLTIGKEGGPAEFLRISGVFRLSSGHIAVINAGTNEIRIFDNGGTYVSTFGRLGSGPGEFRAPFFAWRAGDTLMLDDAQLLRLTAVLAGPSSKLLRTTPLTAKSEKGRGSLRGRTPDGQWLALHNPPMLWEGVKGVARLQASLGLVAEAGSGSVSWFTEVPSGTYFVCNPTGDFKKGGTIGVTPFSPWAYAATTATHIWYGDGASDSLTAMRGSDRHVVRLPIAARRPSAAQLQAYRALSKSRGAPNGEFCTNLALSPDYLPKLLPYYDAVLPGHANEVWVQEYVGTNSAPTRYLVIGPDLKPRAWVPVPAGFRIRDVGRDYVAGVHFDEDDVETVRIYRLTR